MNQAYSGGCACGALRFVATGVPAAQLHCQCRQCQERSGAGHSSYMVFADKAAVTITGEAKFWTVTGDSGNQKDQAFCPTCGTPVFVTFPSAPELTAVCAGSLDAPDRFAPDFVTYTSGGLSWDILDPTLTSFERMPPA